MTDSISRRFARWAANLTYEDLPVEVIDKIKALVLFHLVGAVAGAANPLVQEWVSLAKQEEQNPQGAKVLVAGGRLTRLAAVSANCQIIKGAGMQDSFRMLTHPGPSSIATGLTNTEFQKNTAKEMITALVVGYEVGCRLSYDVLPSMVSRGFYPTAIFGTLNSAMIAGKLLNLSEDGFVAALALAAHSAPAGFQEDGTSAPGHGGGSADRQHVIASANAARLGTLAAVFAKQGRQVGYEYVIEGNAGFLNAYVGSRDGRLIRAFSGPPKIDLSSFTDGLGTQYKLTEVMCRIYNAPGFDQPIIDLLIEMKQKHAFSADDVEEVAVFVNSIESIYPRLELSTPSSAPAVTNKPSHLELFWDIRFWAAHAVVNGGVPVVGGKPFGPTGKDLDSDERVLGFMEKVRVVGVFNQDLFSPEVTIRMKDGTSYYGEFPHTRLEWNFNDLVERLQDCTPGLPGGQGRLDVLVDTMRNAETLSSIDPIYDAAGTP